MTGTVLVIDDVAASRIVLKVKLSAASYEVRTAASAAEGLSLARELKPVLIIADGHLPDMAAADFCAHVRRDSGLANTGLIILDPDDGLFSRVDVLSAGADDVLVKPVGEVTLLAVVRSLVRKRDPSWDLAGSPLVPDAPGAFAMAEAAQPFRGPGLIALVASRPERAVVLKAMLAGRVRDRLIVIAKEGLLDSLNSGPVPDIILTEADLGEPGAGLRLLADLKSRPASRNSAIVVMTKAGDRETGAMALDLGAAAVVSEGLDPDELAVRLRAQLGRKQDADRHRHTLEEGLRLAAYDPLTGLLNRRAGLLSLEQLVRQSRSSGRPLGLLTLDIDCFKGVNDTFGHPAGDLVLAGIAERMRMNFRAGDLLVRPGGEEFLAALPGAGPATCHLAAERLRASVESTRFLLAGGGTAAVTISIGIAVRESQRDLDVEELIAESDRALYMAKRAGRNLVSAA